MQWGWGVVCVDNVEWYMDNECGSLLDVRDGLEVREVGYWGFGAALQHVLLQLAPFFVYPA